MKPIIAVCLLALSQLHHRRDAERSRYLGGRGIRVIRFGNREVLLQMPELLAEILRQAEIAAPHPNPLPGG